MDRLRKPFFIAALVLLALSVLVELGAPVLLPQAPPDCSALKGTKPCAPPPAGLPEECLPLHTSVCEGEAVKMDDVLRTQKENPPTPGLGVPYLALVDGLLLLTLGLMGASLLIPERVHGRVQGLATLMGAVVVLLTGIGLLLAAIALLITMVSLLCAAPFGTIAYLAVWGFFNRGGAAGTLGLLMTFKLAAGVCLVLAHQRFLQNKGLVLLYLTSLLANAVVSFLHGMVPGILVSITDAVGAIVVSILGLIWAVLLLVGALVSIVKVLRLKRVATA
jgi:ABC-type multidrug transport system fused ATPase/permease subunit